jgi:anti-sigma regulatory factor (Ser/Thr protein kinase)
MCDRQSDVRIRLPATPAAVAEVRRVARVVTGHEHVGEHQREVLVLLASEAASNVVRRTSAPVLDVTMGCDGRTVAVRIGDHAPPLALPPADLGPLDVFDGRGLLMIDRLALMWGLSPTEDGWQLWFVAPTQDGETPGLSGGDRVRLVQETAADPLVPQPEPG